jgi:hypothetical protein
MHSQILSATHTFMNLQPIPTLENTTAGHNTENAHPAAEAATDKAARSGGSLHGVHRRLCSSSSSSSSSAEEEGLQQQQQRKKKRGKNKKRGYTAAAAPGSAVLRGWEG